MNENLSSVIIKNIIKKLMSPATHGHTIYIWLNVTGQNNQQDQDLKRHALGQFWPEIVS